MANAFPQNIFGIRNDNPGAFFVGGVNSGIPAYQLSPNEYFWGENVVNRGGLLQTRPGMDARINIPITGNGVLQGLTTFRPTDSQVTYLVFAVDGRIYYAAPPYTTATIALLPNIQFYPGAPMVIFKECIKSVSQAVDGQLNVITPLKVLVMQDGGFTRAAYWDGFNNRHLDPSPGASETPLGQAMEWIGDRLWVARGSELFVSDIADPLKFTETNYLFEGLPFQLPDDCTALKATVDQRQLLAFTNTSTTIFQASIRDRTTWKTTQDFQRLLFPNIGCVGPKAITDQYGMLWWFSMGGWINLNTAMQTYRDSQIDYQDREMSRSKGYLGPMLNRICAGSFENYLMVSVPYCDFYNAHTWVMDQAVLAELGSGVAAAWNSAWTGFRPVEWTNGVFDGIPRCFCASVDYVEYGGTNLRIWEAFKSDRTDTGNPISCFMESKMYADPNADICQIKYIQLLTSELKGCVDIEIFWRGTRGEYKLCGSKQVNATVGPFGSVIIPFYADETLLEDYIKQVRFIRTQDIKKGLASGASESTDTDDVDRAFSIMVKWKGQMSLDAYKISIDAYPDPSQGKVEKEECCSGPENILYQSGKSELVDMPCSGVALFESTQTFTATCPDGFEGDPVTRTEQAVSDISQADADEKALAAATASAEAALICTLIPSSCCLYPYPLDGEGFFYPQTDLPDSVILNMPAFGMNPPVVDLELIRSGYEFIDAGTGYTLQPDGTDSWGLIKADESFATSNCLIGEYVEGGPNFTITDLFADTYEVSGGGTIIRIDLCTWENESFILVYGLPESFMFNLGDKAFDPIEYATNADNQSSPIGNYTDGNAVS